MITNQILRDIRLLSIQNVQSQTIAWYVEQAYRHYSKTYHTPLLLAKEKLTAPEVVLIFMVDEALEMTPEDLVAMKEKLETKHPPMLDPSAGNEEEEAGMSDDEWVAQQIANLDKQSKEPKKEASPSMADAAKQAQQAIQNMYQQINQTAPNTLDGDLKFDIKDE